MSTVNSFDRQIRDDPVVVRYQYIGPVERANLEFASTNAKNSTHSVWALAVNRYETVERLSSRLELASAARLTASPEWARSDISAFTDERNNTVYFRQSEVVIGFSRRSKIDVASIVLRFGLKFKWFDRVGNYGVFLINQDTVGDLLKKLQSVPEVQYAHPNVLDGTDDLELSDLETEGVELPNTELWNHKALLRSRGWSLQDGRGVLISVIDTAIYSDHSGFAGKFIEPSRTFYFGDSEPTPSTHGTSVSSIATDKTVTRYGHTVGLAPAAKLLPVAIDTSAMSSYVGRARAVNFLAKIASEGALFLTDGSRVPVPRLVVNCSWKVEGTQDLTAVRHAFAALTSAGALCVCSAGNASSEAPHYPSDYPGCISVAGLTRDLIKSKNSNFGKSVLFSMPGGNGTPFDDDDVFAAQASGRFDYVSGTSFAAPHVSALLATYWSRNPRLSATELLELVTSKHTLSVDSKNPTFVGKLGAGLICFS